LFFVGILAVVTPPHAYSRIQWKQLINASGTASRQ